MIRRVSNMLRRVLRPRWVRIYLVLLVLSHLVMLLFSPDVHSGFSLPRPTTEIELRIPRMNDDGPSGRGDMKITGLHFTATSAVKFGTLEGVFTVNGDGTEITVATPSTAAAGTVDVFVTNPAGTSVAGTQTQYIFTGSGGAPAVTALSPSGTAINTSGVEVTITGVNFAQGATVKFGTEPATSVQVLTSTTIKAVAPLRTTTGTVDVTVTTGAGTSSIVGSGNDFTYGTPSGSTLTVTYNLYVRFTLITWDGKDNIGVGDALRGIETPTDLPATNNVTAATTAVFAWSANGAGCTGSGACWLGYFPSGVGVPGANNLAVLVRGGAYWIAVTVQTNWTTRQGP